MKFETINQTARKLNIPACFLRAMVKQGRVPGFYSGTRFYCNTERLAEQLNALGGELNGK